ncbi:HNH endonuclease [Hydrogenophaga borbori]|uniref:HNH endonuclease n=1 Tax=Hydrogenophaga borbori TaxID=2294117 RepID=UPI0011C0D615|nr:HNH endonuclease [Hydrogenophaga borbori]
MRAIDFRQMVGTKVDDAAILSGLENVLGLHWKSKARILAAYKSYKRRRGSTALTALNLSPSLAEQLSDLYSGKAAKHGLSWIKVIASTADFGYCPMCGSETHKTVEHLLPRKPWAEFSIFSLNLIPSCGNCNSKRGNHANSPTVKHRLLHPYFDSSILSKRLHITKISGPYAAPKYEPAVVSGLAPRTRAKVLNHIRKNIDLIVYQQYCTNRWSEMQMEAKAAGDEAALKKRIDFNATTAPQISGPNSWRTAFFSGLASDPSIVSWLFANRHAF